MSLQLHWFLPSHGDGREVGKTAAGNGGRARTIRRAPDIDYLAQVARAADRLGFVSVLTPFGLFCEDPWLVGAVLARETTRLKYMVALRPGFASPTLVAQMAATFQRLSGDRLLLNIVTGGDADEQRRYGDWLDHDARYDRTDEFLTVLRNVWTGAPFTFEGEHYNVSNALLARAGAQLPTLFLGGSSEAARRVAIRHVDVYLTWGEPPDRLTGLLTDVRRRAAEEGREISFGTRFHVISRDTSAQAWQVANDLIEGMDPALIRKAQERFRRTESEGQRRMAELHAGGAGLELYPNVWAGYGLVRPGAAVTLVGSHEEVAERIEEYHALGVDHLILSGQPHLEEAYWFGEGVLPLLRARGLLDGSAGEGVDAGEGIGAGEAVVAGARS
jgi:alkanesulfonate monooxygenase